MNNPTPAANRNGAGGIRWERETLGLYLTGHPINQYLKEIERYVGGVRLKDMHPTERGKVITAAGLVVAARVMVTKRGNRIGICTLDDRSSGWK